MFSGRYKALIVDGSGNGYLKTACDYVHLNPVRARLLAPEERLLGYPWSRFGSYLATPEHRPAWLRVDRLLGEHGIGADTVAGREEFERRMEARRAEDDGGQWAKVRRGWCLGGEEFRQQMLDRIAERWKESHGGAMRQEAEAGTAERIIREELGRLGWVVEELEKRPKGDAAKLAIAARLRRETTLTVKEIAERLSMGTWKSARTMLHRLKQGENEHEK